MEENELCCRYWGTFAKAVFLTLLVKNLTHYSVFHSQPALSPSPCSTQARPERWLILPSVPLLAGAEAPPACRALRIPAECLVRATVTTWICWSGFCRSPNWWWWRSPRRGAWDFAMSVRDAQPAASWVRPALKPTRLSLPSRWDAWLLMFFLRAFKGVY